MKTRDVLIICVTALAIAWLKYVLPVLEREADRDLQRAILWSIPAPTPTPARAPAPRDESSEFTTPESVVPELESQNT